MSFITVLPSTIFYHCYILQLNINITNHYSLNHFITSQSIPPSNHSTTHTIFKTTQSSHNLPPSQTLTTLTSNGGDKEVEVPTRSSHHSIEKRYRMSINDRIVELRELLAGKDSKVCAGGCGGVWGVRSYTQMLFLMHERFIYPQMNR